MNILPTITGAIGHFFTNLVHKDTGLPPTPTSIPGVPAQYQNVVNQASTHTGIPAPKLAAQFNAENGGKWDPTLRGRADPTDFGMTQLNPIAVSTITGKAGGRNYFKENYGHEFNQGDPSDQVLGSGVYLNWLRQQGLPKAGIQTPTDEQVMTAYNTGATGLARAQNGVARSQRRARTYQALINSKEIQ